ncbi:DNA mismatch repair protein [Cryobacterium sp. TMT1-62]|uniref:DNA mismatch repair protein n=1 Tax=Cryobacterium sandaracinum TaxID=1259247 RepID=A0ABY2J9T6_9MICO|nr:MULTISPECIES: DNA mismatch repair protein [Cryobacterium]TFB57105.1 DNA mismatch repair protein [Cryobacterium sp. Sr3]TFB58654.1 DNA mismatch repair protein [Cryobacterium sp. Hz7]TFC33246.1 DNA mismatch repair protein [Cryobacterium sp. TMT2-14]TFC50915.1 DNA mismatch repair protein [Cryobacterium sp. TMT2-17-1]TFD01707.1 DNA mismatch repair protein [Cryobacterium sandaracinum]
MSTPASPLPRLPVIRGLQFVPVKDGLWRVSNRSGMVLGHIERRTEVDGDHFAARRLLAATRTMNVGSFWRIDDAADCFR